MKRQTSRGAIHSGKSPSPTYTIISGADHCLIREYSRLEPTAFCASSPVRRGSANPAAGRVATFAEAITTACPSGRDSTRIFTMPNSTGTESIVCE